MIRFRSLVLFLLAAQLASAQGADHLRQAERYHASGDFYNAAVQYEEYLGIRKSNSAGFTPYAPQKTGSSSKGTAAQKSALLARLAGCYYNLHDYAKAADYYAKAGSSLSISDRIAFASSLRATGRGAEAQQLLGTLQADVSLTALQRLQVQRELQSVQFAAQPADSLFNVSKASGDLNTGHGNYAAVEWGGVVFFTSSRADSASNGKGPNRNHLYRVVGTDALNADPLPGQDLDQGLGSFTADGKRFYFTAWSREGGRNTARIYTVTREDGGWTTPVALDSNINAAGSSNAQPFYVEKDGVRYLLFSSNRAGGAGGYDLWVSTLNGNAASAPQNLGSVVNTAGDESAPFYHSATQTLVFASNGHPGLGGFDLFASNGTLQGLGPAHNLGAPLNSVKDDSYFFSASPESLYAKAYLSSDRASDCCLEIFTVTKKEPPVVELPPAPMPVDTAHIVEVPPYKLPVIVFEFDKATLSAEAMQQLDSVAVLMQTQAERKKLRIGGYTDGKGGEGYNNRLSDRRARAVRDYLYSKGIASELLWIKGFGECCPLETEEINGQDNPAARAKNRRVELTWESER
ncbi:OmpA family protein [Flaviaesturariibacter terrae]